MAKSGGLTARNTRQGFRSEYIARFIFSAFGTAVEVSQGNDIGIDLLCNMTSFNGLLIYYKSSYGVQIKSSDDAFMYVGKQATTWLSKLEYPLLLSSIDKEKGRIKIYSTWNLNRYLLSLHTDNEELYPESITFTTSEESTLPGPNVNGTIPVGKPILDFDFSDIDNPELFEKYYSVLDTWLEFDNKNILLRRSGIPVTFGYTQWETNKPIQESNISWNKEVFYSNFHNDKIFQLMAQSFISLGIFNRDNFNGSGDEKFRKTFNDYKSFIENHLFEYLDDFGKGIFSNEL